ncbi:MAG: hypothetical protein OEQ28_09620 [Acidobacteriota bacterium]|nr:hypothetical protein [Acidobacteriota bacterium]
MFLGSAVASLFLLALGWQLGLIDGETPGWTWITAILMVDVAHVWSTSFRTYFDTEELKSRLWLYLLVPSLGYLFGVLLYSEGRMVFWRILAYIAVFHFVRQQYGWVALYRRKGGETSKFSYWIDTAAIYISTIYPLSFWMTSGQRNFNWFVEGDFAVIPQLVETLLFPFYIVALVLYFGKSVYQYYKYGLLTIGKDIVVATTAICWYVGIVALNSDYAFTVTNVIIHGVPYFALIYLYARSRRKNANRIYRGLSSNWIVFLATLWLFAYFEELVWHKGVWHEKSWLFGAFWDLEGWKMYIVPLLAVPQITHYVLDGFIWKRKYNQFL